MTSTFQSTRSEESLWLLSIILVLISSTFSGEFHRYGVDVRNIQRCSGDRLDHLIAEVGKETLDQRGFRDHHKASRHTSNASSALRETDFRNHPVHKIVEHNCSTEMRCLPGRTCHVSWPLIHLQVDDSDNNNHCIDIDSSEDNENFHFEVEFKACNWSTFKSYCSASIAKL